MPKDKNAEVQMMIEQLQRNMAERQPYLKSKKRQEFFDELFLSFLGRSAPNPEHNEPIPNTELPK